MIWESEYWKEPLLKSAIWLRKVRFHTGTYEKTLIRIEKEIFVGFYSIRKLLDTYKVSDSTKQTEYNLTWYPNKKSVDYFNWDHLERNYDLNKRYTETRDLQFICNQFIHSFLFLIDGDERIDGFFVVSDQMRNQKVYYIFLEQVLQAFRLIGRDYPATGQWTRDLETGKFNVSVGHLKKQDHILNNKSVK